MESEILYDDMDNQKSMRVEEKDEDEEDFEGFVDSNMPPWNTDKITLRELQNVELSYDSSVTGKQVDEHVTDCIILSPQNEIVDVTPILTFVRLSDISPIQSLSSNYSLKSYSLCQSLH